MFKPIEVIQCRTEADLARCAALDKQGTLASGSDPCWEQMFKQIEIIRAGLPPGFTIAPSGK